MHNEKSPVLTVVTVCFNDAEALQRTLQSVAGQRECAIQHIVVDGGSRDGTLALLEGWKGHPIEWVSEADKGIYDAMNKGAARARGQFVQFLNAGDVYASDQALAMVVDQLMSDPTVDVLFGGANYVNARGRRIYRSPKRIDSYIWHGLPAIHQATFYRTAVFVPYSGEFAICGDYFEIASLWRRGVEAGYLNTAVVDFMLGGISYQKPWLLIREAARVQRNVLGMQEPLIWLSAGRRIAARVGAFLVYSMPGRR